MYAGISSIAFSSFNYLKSIYFLRFFFLFFLYNFALFCCLRLLRISLAIIFVSSICNRLFHLVNIIIIFGIYRVQFA